MSMPAGPSVRIEVADTGHGMSEETRATLVRAVLHDEGAGQGDGPGTGLRLRHRQAERRPHRRRERAGPGLHRSTICLPGRGGRVSSSRRRRARDHEARVDGYRDQCSSWRTIPSVRHTGLRGAGGSRLRCARGLATARGHRACCRIRATQHRSPPDRHGDAVHERKRARPAACDSSSSRRARSCTTTGLRPGARLIAPDDASPLLEKPFVPSTLLRVVRTALDAASARRAERPS